MRKIVLTFILFSSSVNAGGDHFPVEITHAGFSPKNPNNYLIVGKPILSEREWFDSECDKFIITGSYDFNKWIKYPNLINETIHEESMAILAKAAKEKTKVYLGYISDGLVKKTECTYSSKGLINSNGNQVYSINESI